MPELVIIRVFSSVRVSGIIINNNGPHIFAYANLSLFVPHFIRINSNTNITYATSKLHKTVPKAEIVTRYSRLTVNC